MGAPGYTIFCKNGHIVQHVPHHYIANYQEGVCSVCNSNETHLECEWGDDDYGPHDVPYEPTHYEPISNVAVYDVSNASNWTISTRNENRVCKKCGAEFVLAGGEIDFFTRKKLNLPTTCRKCREIARVEKKYANLG